MLEVPSLVELMPLKNYKLIQEESFLKLNYCQLSTTRSLLLVGVKKTVLNFGMQEIVGEPIGEKMDFSEFKCIETISALKRTALGVFLRKNLLLLGKIPKALKFSKCDHKTIYQSLFIC